MSAAPPFLPATVVDQLKKREQMALQMQAIVSQMLLDHQHAEVLDTLLGAYLTLVTTCPNCTEQAIRMLPALAAQLKAIADIRPDVAKAPSDTPSGTPSGGQHLH